MLNNAISTVSSAQDLAIARSPVTPSIPREEQERIESTARDMEQLFVNQLLKAMWKTVPESDYGMKGTPGEIYRDMFNDQISRIVSEGQGIGLRQVIQAELTSRKTDNRLQTAKIT